MFLVMLIDNILFNYTRITLTELFNLYTLCTQLHKDELLEVETCKKDISGKLLFIVDHGVCWIQYCMIHFKGEHFNTFKAGACLHCV